MEKQAINQEYYQIWDEIKQDKLKFRTTLVFWKLYDSFLNFSQKELKNLLKNSEHYGDKVSENYTFKNNEGNLMPLKWIATTGHLFLPICLKISKQRFIGKNNPAVQGKLEFEAHIFPEGVVVMQARLDFSDFMSIDDLVYSSHPTNVMLPNGMDMKDTLDKFESELVNFLQTKINREKKTFGEKASPWHHNWIWWETSPEIDKEEFDIGGKYFKYALGMCTRSDKWKHISFKNYKEIEDVINLSPYDGTCVYITHPGNVIIPGKEFTDPNAVKNTIIDVLFAVELGNVQRFLILEHLQDFNFQRLKIEETLMVYDKEEKGQVNLELKDIVNRLENIDEEINSVVLEIYKDLQVSRTPRLIFTSVFKTRLFKQMIKVLHGWEFNDNLLLLVKEIRESLSRERDTVRVKINEKENNFLRNLQLVFVIGLVAQLITLFYAVDAFDLVSGGIFVGISLIISMLILWVLKKMR
ncbi:MAG: hypothetical protein ACTSVU_10225 [Promethearchaeota archaeon]